MGLGFLALTAFVALLPSSPLAQSVPGRDSGAFLYVARGILDGLPPYVELWDHKGPALYAINAIGLALPLPGWWGNWLLRWALLALGLAACWRALAPATGPVAAGLATAVTLAYFVGLAEDGNFTEEYAFCLGFLALGLARSAGRCGPRWIGIGALGMACALMRQNLVGPFVALAAVEALGIGRDDPFAIRAANLGRALLGGSVVLAAFGLWLAAGGALGAWWECTFTYNRVYASGSGLEHLFTTLRRASSSPALVALALVAVLGFAECLRRLASRAEDDRGRALVAFALLDAPLEVVAASLSGHGYLHYFLPCLIPSAVLLAALFQRLASPAPATLATARADALRLALPGLLLVAVPTLVWVLPRLGGDEIGRLREATADYVTHRTATSDRIWIWGAESGVLVRAARSSPHPYFYAYPLVKSGFEPWRRLDLLAERLAQDPPALIIDTSATNPLLPPLDRKARASWRPADSDYAATGLDPIFDFVAANYRVEATIGGKRPWVVYRVSPGLRAAR